jgi:CRP-like cAMP-binding protein
MLRKDWIKGIDIFQDLEENELIKILSIVSQETYKNKERVFNQGDIENKLYAVIEGKVELLKINQYSKNPVVLCTISPGETFWEAVLLGEFETDCSAIAIGKKTIIAIWDGKALRTVLDENPQLANKVLWRLLEKFYNRIKLNAQVFGALLFLTEQRE